MSTHTTPTPARALDAAAFTAAAQRIGVSTDVASAAAANIAAGAVVLLGINAKFTGGKDTIAPLVMDALGVTDAVHHYYAVALKDEVDAVIVLTTASDSVLSAAANIATAMDVDFDKALHVAQTLFEATRDEKHELTARTRTPEIRTVLQYWGTEVRRSQDENYWVKKALRPALEAAADGRSVYFTDVRFPNEVTWAQEVGFSIVRLDISPETQRRRSLARDGREPDPEAVNHVSETALDGFDGFDLRLDNDVDHDDLTTTNPVVQAIAAFLRRDTAAAA